MSKLYTSQRINIKPRWGTAENPHGLYIKSNLKPLNIQGKKKITTYDIWVQIEK